MRLRAVLIAVVLALASTASAQNLRGLARATAITGGNDSALTLVSDSAFRTRATSLHELFKRSYGTATKPSFTFTLDSATGMYGVSGQVRFAISGVLQGALHSGGFQLIAGAFNAPNGTAASPSILFSSSPSSGFYQVGTDTIGITTGGARSLGVRGGATATLFGGAGNMIIQAGTGNSRTLTLRTTGAGGTTQDNLVANADGSITVTSCTGCATPFPILAPNGTVAAPSYSFAAESNLGLYLLGTDTLGIAIAGATALQIPSAGKLLGGAGNMILTAGTGNSRTLTLQSTNSSGTAKSNLVLGTDSTTTLLGQGLGYVGTAALPAWSFAGDPNTGLYNVGPDTLGIVTGGGLSLVLRGGSTPYLSFGGSSASFGAFRKNGTGIDAVLADGSNYAQFQAAAIFSNGHVQAAVDNTYDLGTASLRWRELYINPAASGAGDTYICLSTGQQVHAGVTCAASTLKMKDSVVAYTNADAVLKLRPVTFNFKAGYYGQRAEIGLIAEEAALVDPRFVFVATKLDTLSAVTPTITRNVLTQKLDTAAVVIKPGEPEALNISSIVAALVAQVQVQKRQLDSLSAVVFTLQPKAP